MFGDTDGSRVRYYSFSTYHYMQPEENSFVHNAYPFIAYKPAGNLRFEIGPGWEGRATAAFYVATIPDPPRPRPTAIATCSLSSTRPRSRRTSASTCRSLRP